MAERVSLVWIEEDPDNRELIKHLGQVEHFRPHPFADPEEAHTILRRLATQGDHERIRLIVDPTSGVPKSRMTGLRLASETATFYPSIGIASINTSPEHANLKIGGKPLFMASFGVPGFDQSIEEIARDVINRTPRYEVRNSGILDYQQRSAMIPIWTANIREFIHWSRQGYNPSYTSRYLHHQG